MKEVFKNIKGYEGIYSISNLGKVKSQSRVIIDIKGVKKHIKSRIMKTQYNNGDEFVTLHINNNRDTRLVKDLVLEAGFKNVAQRYHKDNKVAYNGLEVSQEEFDSLKERIFQLNYDYELNKVKNPSEVDKKLCEKIAIQNTNGEMKRKYIKCN